MCEILEGGAAVFPNDPPPSSHIPCSYNECLSGHKWPQIILIAKCEGCGGPVLAIQKTQCPFCNEPTVKTQLRSDFLPRGAGVARRCLGEGVNGESLDLEMLRTAWQTDEAGFKDFETKRAAERTSPK